MGPLALEGEFWRRAARWGASVMPEWFVRTAPPAIGLFVCTLAGDQRRRSIENVRRIRGRRAPVRDLVDAGRTFVNYALCVTETLGAGSTRARLPEVVIHGELHTMAAIDDGRGVVIVTAHTGGWESVGPLMTRDLGLRVMIAESAERDAGAGEIQDSARRQLGLLVAHVGDDPLSALPLARHLRDGGVVALQIDRLPARQRRRAVTLFDRPGHIPEGPLRLAALTAAPILPVFASRAGHRRYDVHVYSPIRVPRDASDPQLDVFAQRLADAMQHFLRAHPTQWFHFGSGAEWRGLART